jgi:hypothetical protein
LGPGDRDKPIERTNFDDPGSCVLLADIPADGKHVGQRRFVQLKPSLA